MSRLILKDSEPGSPSTPLLAYLVTGSPETTTTGGTTHSPPHSLRGSSQTDSEIVVVDWQSLTGSEELEVWWDPNAMDTVTSVSNLVNFKLSVLFEKFPFELARLRKACVVDMVDFEATLWKEVRELEQTLEDQKANEANDSDEQQRDSKIFVNRQQNAAKFKTEIAMFKENIFWLSDMVLLTAIDSDGGLRLPLVDEITTFEQLRGFLQTGKITASDSNKLSKRTTDSGGSLPSLRSPPVPDASES